LGRGLNAVSDASALLAVLLKEAGGEQVFRLMRHAPISAVNLAECFSRAVEDEHSATLVDALLARLDMEVVPFTIAHARQTAALRPASKHLGLSLGDRACVALGLERGLPILTADRRLASFEADVDIRMIR
jgi:ribonuclease VapC